MKVHNILFPEGTPLRKSKKPVRVLGIDLGTTNSTVAEIIYNPASNEGIKVRCLPIEQLTENRSYWNPLVPSIVALQDGKEVIGEGARQLRANGRSADIIEECNLFASVKNNMGLQRTYHMAPAGYRSAAEVSGRILNYLYKAAMEDKTLPLRTTVTVPASFQAAQRSDTLKAATLAGMSVKDGDLLDEPVAAFIAYLAQYPDSSLVEIGETKHLLVFDFGGGTCDVAVFRLTTDLVGNLQIASLSVSRYNRLGGGDIDQAILYEYLLPILLEQNGLSRHVLDFDTKKNIIEPAFIGIAEQLKIGLCEKLVQAIENADHLDTLAETIHKKYTCRLPDGTSLNLINPTLDLNSFEKILGPFLDTDVLYVRETEYFQTLSIFTPIIDALERADLKDGIDICLMVGGSSLIPQVPIAMSHMFPHATMHTFSTADEMQTAVAQGAALNALSLAIQERPIIQPVSQETIALATSSGLFDLVLRGTALPYPAGGGFKQITNLMLTESSLTDAITMRVEVVAREEMGQRILLSELWDIPAPVVAGDRVRLEYRYDENQVLELRAYAANREYVQPLKERKEHPLTHVSNPQAVKLRIESTEEKLRTGTVNAEERRAVILDLAKDCAELRQYEKAISKLSELLRQRNEPDALILNRMALYSNYMDDFDKAEKLYVESSAADPSDDAPWFNLALLLRRQKRFDEARHAVDMAIALDDRSAPPYILKAQIIKESGKGIAVYELLDMGRDRFSEIERLDDWQLSWYITAAEMSGDDHGVARAKTEWSHRKAGNSITAHEQQKGMLPSLAE